MCFGCSNDENEEYIYNESILNPYIAELEVIEPGQDYSEDKKKTIITIPFATQSDSDSLEEDEYYDNYNNSSTEEYNAVTLQKMLEIARREANDNLHTMSREKFGIICLSYDMAINACGKNTDMRSLKKRIIKEYELMKHAAPRILFDSDNESRSTIESHLVMARSENADSDIRKMAYRNAIRLTVDLTDKNKLKHEYNNYLISLRANLF